MLSNTNAGESRSSATSTWTAPGASKVPSGSPTIRVRLRSTLMGSSRIGPVPNCASTTTASSLPSVTVFVSVVYPMRMKRSEMVPDEMPSSLYRPASSVSTPTEAPTTSTVAPESVEPSSCALTTPSTEAEPLWATSGEARRSAAVSAAKGRSRFIRIEAQLSIPSTCPFPGADSRRSCFSCVSSRSRAEDENESQPHMLPDSGRGSKRTSGGGKGTPHRRECD